MNTIDAINNLKAEDARLFRKHRNAIRKAIISAVAEIDRPENFAPVDDDMLDAADGWLLSLLARTESSFPRYSGPPPQAPASPPSNKASEVPSLAVAGDVPPMPSGPNKR